MTKVNDLIDIINEQHNRFRSGRTLSNDFDGWETDDEDNSPETNSFRIKQSLTEMYGLTVISFNNF